MATRCGWLEQMVQVERARGRWPPRASRTRTSRRVECKKDIIGEEIKVPLHGAQFVSRYVTGHGYRHRTGERVRGLVWSRTRYIIHTYIYIQAQWMISSQMAGILRSRAVGVFRVYRVALRVRYRHAVPYISYGTRIHARIGSKHVRYTAE
jgi:hypothetical protein